MNTIYGVIDIGSNSVRNLVYSDGKILYKSLITTRLGEGLAVTGRISAEAESRTVKAIKTLYDKCVECGAQIVYPFATEAVRCALNGKRFVDEVERAVGVRTEVVEGKEEGNLGLLGAFHGKDGAIIDIGGASAEISVAKGGKITYSHSLPLGAVRLKDICGEDEEKLEKVISERIKEYGNVPKTDRVAAIGGTATSLCAVDLNLAVYDESKVDGHFLSRNNLKTVLDKIKNSTKKERVEKLHIEDKRAEIIFGGGYLLYKIVEMLKIDGVNVSESDNMLGYIYKKVYGMSYET